MAITLKATQYTEKMVDSGFSQLAETDAEFAQLFQNFAFDEVVSFGNLSDKTRYCAILAALIGCQGLQQYKVMASAALKFNVTPVEIKEIVYQATAYLGIGRVYPFLQATNEVFEENGIKLPLEKQSTVDRRNRLENGEQAQVDIFGEQMRGFSQSGATETRHINRWLSSNCFGDYYTRNGLDYNAREMITFCFLAAQGGCEVQLTVHARANIKIGNDKDFLIDVLSQCLPYIGYPRTLNALRCVAEASK